MYTSFLYLFFSTKVISCWICYCSSLWMINKSKSWFLYGNTISISYAMVYSKLQWLWIISTYEFIKYYIIYSRFPPLTRPSAWKFNISIERLDKSIYFVHVGDGYIFAISWLWICPWPDWILCIQYKLKLSLS